MTSNGLGLLVTSLGLCSEQRQALPACAVIAEFVDIVCRRIFENVKISSR